MKGSIRVIAGLLITFEAVGGIENGSALLPCLAIAGIGLFAMFSGTEAMKTA